MRITVSRDAGSEGEASVLHLLRGVFVNIRGGHLHAMDGEIITADVDEHCTWVAVHPYDEANLAYDYDQAVTIDVTEDTVITYL